MASVQRVPVEKMVAAKATAAAVAVLVALTVCASVVAAGRRWSKDDDRRGGGEGSPPGGGHGEVTYDGRALIVNGTRRVLFSGDMHYTRSTPEMWPKLIAKAKQGGLDVIQTYVFWNVHEPVHGQYNFEGRYDLVKFIREIQAQGLFVSLRVGPFIEAEWKYGGFPFWLHDVPNITFRSDNEPFKQHMQRFVTKIVGLMKYEKLYYLQGGPIIISQIENEYQMVEPAFHSHGPPYVRWAAAMAVNLSTGVPWMMCKQDDAPDPVINTCNGLICGETFVGPNSPKKPALWTENWTARYPLYGHDPSSRSAGELAFAAALFIARKNGSFVNYYMYHGGTNFGRYASSYVTTSYYDGAPLDEYGLVWQRTWAHLKELHDAVKQSSEPLLWGSYSNFSLGPQQEAHVFETDSKCVAFLVNFDKHQAPNIQFRNIPLQLARRSISILSDCRKVVFETAKVNAKQGSRTTKAVQSLNGMNIWEAFKEPIPRVLNESTYTFLEQLSTTEDETDYLWYIASYDYKPSDDEEVVMLNVESRAHVLHAFVNNEYVGSVHGSHDGPPNIVLKKSVSLKEGENIISLLSVMVGSPDSGAFMERKTFGLREVSIQLGQQEPQLLNNGLWGYQVGLYGERHQIFTRGGSHTVQWTAMNNATHQPLTWYKTTFDTPTGDDPVTLNLTGMSKGEAWINGDSIGRYWVSFKAPSGQPSQSLFHVPRYFLKPTSENLLVLVEEMAGDPRQITVNTMSVAMTRVCGNVNESSARSPAVRLRCEEGKRISAVEFASYGNPAGDCTSFRVGRCHAETSELVVKKACLGRSTCFVPVSAAMLGGDPCPTIDKSLLVVASCA